LPELVLTVRYTLGLQLDISLLQASKTVVVKPNINRTGMQAELHPALSPARDPLTRSPEQKIKSATNSAGRSFNIFRTAFLSLVNLRI
jgi:hypothetical protein